MKEETHNLLGVAGECDIMEFRWVWISTLWPAIHCRTNISVAFNHNLIILLCGGKREKKGKDFTEPHLITVHFAGKHVERKLSSKTKLIVTNANIAWSLLMRNCIQYTGSITLQKLVFRSIHPFNIITRTHRRESMNVREW